MMTFNEKIWAIFGATVLLSMLMLGICGAIQSTPDHNAPLYLEKHGYSKIQVFGIDPNNCPARMRSTYFVAIKDGRSMHGTLCNSIFSDTAFVREF